MHGSFRDLAHGNPRISLLWEQTMPARLGLSPLIQGWLLYQSTNPLNDTV
jgi:hypothetical protein